MVIWVLQGTGGRDGRSKSEDLSYTAALEGECRDRFLPRVDQEAQELQTSRGTPPYPAVSDPPLAATQLGEGPEG